MFKAWKAGTMAGTICLILTGCHDDRAVVNPEHPRSGTPIQAEASPTEGATYRVIRAQPIIQRRCQDLNDRREQLATLMSTLRDQWKIHLTLDQMPQPASLQMNTLEEDQKIRATLETFEQLANKTIEECLSFLSLEEALQWREESRIASRANFHLATMRTIDAIEHLEAELKETYGLTIVFLPDDSFRFHVVDQESARTNSLTPINSLGLFFQLHFYLQRTADEQDALARNFASASYFGKRAYPFKGEIYPAKQKLHLIDEFVSFMLNSSLLPSDVVELICLFEESAR